MKARMADHVRAASRRYERAGWSVVDQSIVSACNFMSVLLLARFLPPAEFGAFVLAQTGLLLVTGLQTSLLTQPHNVLGARLQGDAYRRFTGALVLAQLLAGALLSAVLVLIGAAVYRYGDAAAGVVVLALAGAALPWMAQEFVRRVMYTTSDTRRAAANDLLCYGLQLAGVWLLVREARAEQLSAVSALSIFGGSSLVAALFGVWQLRREIGFAAGARFGASLRRAWAQVWHFGRWLLAQNVTVWLGANGHAWLVGALLGVEAVGLYRAAIHLVNVINPLRQAAFAYLPARGSVAYQSGGHAGLWRWVRRISPRLTLALLPFVVVLVAMPEAMLALVYGDRFAGLGLGPILALATLAQTISFLRYPMECAVLATGATRSLFQIHLLPIVLLPTLGTALIASFGLLGVPWSMLLISGVLFIVTCLVYRQLMVPALPAAVQRG
jgi:O-antigen/teichoic acid export membrane protein